MRTNDIIFNQISAEYYEGEGKIGGRLTIELMKLTELRTLNFNLDKLSSSVEEWRAGR